MDGSHWSAPYHVFGEVAAVGMSAAKSNHDYNYKTDFEIWKENQEFERQILLMSQPPLDSSKEFGAQIPDFPSTYTKLR